MRKLAVVGHQQQALGLGIQTPDMHKPDASGVVQLIGVLHHPLIGQVGDGGPALGILHGGDDARRFVHHDGDDVGIGQDPGAVETDLLRRRVDPQAGLGDGHTVDADSSRGDEALAGASRGDSGMGKDLLQALAAGHIWVIVSPADQAAARPLRLLVESFDVILVVEVPPARVEFIAAHQWLLSLISSSMPARAAVSGR